jgi:hypothetical protein
MTEGCFKPSLVLCGDLIAGEPFHCILSPNDKKSLLARIHPVIIENRGTGLPEKALDG